MGESFITASDLFSYNTAMSNLHATFARPIVIYRNAQQVIISTNPSNNFLFDSAPFNNQIQTTAVSGVFQARILYAPNQATAPFDIGRQMQGSAQNVLQMEHGSVRIKLDVTGASYLFDAKTVTFDDQIFSITSSKRPHSVIGTPQFYDFTLKKQN